MSKTKVNLISWIILIAYLLGLIYLMFFGFSRVSREFYMYNFVPLKTIMNYIIYYDYYNFDIWIINLIGNIVVFIPFGLLLPMINKQFQKKIKLMLVFIFGISILEISQLILRVGSFDIDDIILNSIGVLLGLSIYKRIIHKLLSKSLNRT